MSTSETISLKGTKIGFIGGGVMGSAIIAGLIRQNLITPHEVIVSDPLPQQQDKLSTEYQIHTTGDNLQAIAERDIVVLAIKPQMFAKVSRELRGQIPTKAMVLSILAGTTIKALCGQLDHKRVVRTIPNTPAQIGQGMTVWTSTAAVTEQQKRQAQTIVSSLGEALFVDEEHYLDMATALSGSGPAFVFLFLEAMIDAGVHLGFSRQVAQQLVYQNAIGSLAFAKESGLHPVELRNMVTSPGGTTAEGLYELDQGGFRTTVAKAIWAAYEKSRRLGSLDKNE